MASPKSKSPANAEAAKAKKPKPVVFPAPKGLNVEGTEKGDKHDMLATFVFDGEGNITLAAIEGIPISATKPKPAPKAEKADEEEDAADGGADEAAEGEGDEGDGTGIADNETTPAPGGFVDSMS